MTGVQMVFFLQIMKYKQLLIEEMEKLSLKVVQNSHIINIEDKLSIIIWNVEQIYIVLKI